jgi:hypothetical protein
MADTQIGEESAESVKMALILGRIDTKLAVLGNEVCGVKEAVSRLDKAFFGNGKPGLIEDHKNLEIKVNEHLKEDNKIKEHKEKISGRTWAIILCVIGAFTTQTAGLIFLFIRTGAIK